MTTPVQVIYATHSGSTAEVAEAIGAALREAGIATEVKRAKEINAIDGSTPVILGAPLYMLRLTGEMHRFLNRNRDALSLVRSWFFVLGPVEQKEEQFKQARAQAEKELARFAWLNLAELKVFGGRFDPSRLGFPLSLMNKLPASPLRKVPATDARDWDAIRAWANGIARQLRPAA